MCLDFVKEAIEIVLTFPGSELHKIGLPPEADPSGIAWGPGGGRPGNKIPSEKIRTNPNIG